MRCVFSLLLASLAVVSAIPQSTASQEIQYENITIYATDDRIGYFPTCPSKELPQCQGSWVKYADPRFSNGVAMVAGNPSHYFSDQEPYLTLTFKAKAMYMYQWYNKTSGYQKRFYGKSDWGAYNLTALEYQPDELTEVMMWSMTDLDPYAKTNIGLQHISWPGIENIILDRIVITAIVGIDQNSGKGEDKNKMAKVGGAVVGSVLGFLFLGIVAYCMLKRHRRLARNSTGRHDWAATNPQASLKFQDPSSEIMASERIAKEGQVEESQDKDKRSSRSIHSLRGT